MNRHIQSFISHSNITFFYHVVYQFKAYFVVLCNDTKCIDMVCSRSNTNGFSVYISKENLTFCAHLFLNRLGDVSRTKYYFTYE